MKQRTSSARRGPWIRGALLAGMLALTACRGSRIGPHEDASPATTRSARMPAACASEDVPAATTGHGPRASRRLTLGMVRARILERANLHLAAEEYRKAEAQGRVRQAALPPNPYVILRKRRVSNLDLYGTGLGEIEVGQPIELGKKRRARITLAQAEAAMVSEGVRALTVLTLHDAEAWFYRVLRLEEDLGVAREAERVAAELEGLARIRFEGGKDSRVPVLRFQAAAETARLAVQDLERQHESACRQMDEFVGLPSGTTRGAEGTWERGRLDQFDRQAAVLALRHHPRRLVTDRELAAANRSVRRAKADAWPDLIVGLMGERDADLEASYLGLSLYVPVPLWNRNQGERVRAEAAVRRARRSIDAETLRLAVELDRAILKHERSTRNVDGYEARIIPTLDTSVSLARTAYEGGKGSYLDVLDALLAWIRARRERLGHMEEQAQATVTIRYLTGAL